MRPKRGAPPRPIDVVRAALSDLDPEVVASLPRKYHLVGQVLLLQNVHARIAALSTEQLRRVGDAYLALPQVRATTVALELVPPHGELRVPSVSVIAGDADTSNCVHVEGGVRYCLDPTRVMFSSGNVGERMHFHTNVDASGQVVVDMFAGIGYFTLPLACSMLGRPACIHALELNPGDNREGYLERCADRVLMGYIPTPRSFVPRALQLLRWPQGGVVHYHYTATEEEANTLPLCHFEQPVFRVRMLARRTVKSYAPRVWHYVADLECVPIVVVAMEQEGLTGVGALAAAVGSMSLAEAAQWDVLPGLSIVAFLDAEKEGAVLKLRRDLLTGPAQGVRHGVDKDPHEAVKRYTLAANQGHADAQNHLGVCYANGTGVDKDPHEAVKWYTMAANQGHAVAQYNLGVCYANGLGVDKDPHEAVKWYAMANQGHADAQNNLDTDADAVARRCGAWARFIVASERGCFAATPGLEGAAPSRLIREDVARTFALDAHRAVLADTCTRLQRRLGDYSQAMSFVAAFFSVFMPRAAAFELTTSLARSPAYLGSCWWDRVAFGTEAFTFAELLAEREPAVAAHFAKLTVLPEAYTQRWFLALGVNVLPYRQLLDVVEAFLVHGLVVLHRMGLAIVSLQRDELLKCTQTGTCLALLVQPKDAVVDEVARLAAAADHVTEAHLASLRLRVREKYHARLVPAAGQDSTRKHTGETSSEDEDSSELSEAVECFGCEDNVPELQCQVPECGLLLCERCHKKGRKGHLASHAVKSVEDVDYEQLQAMAAALKAKQKK